MLIKKWLYKFDCLAIGITGREQKHYFSCIRRTRKIIIERLLLKGRDIFANSQ